MSDASRSRGRRTLLAVTAVFVVPLVIAWVWFLGAQQFGNLGRTNNGELVDPARPLTAFQLRLLDGSMLELADLRRTWTLVYVAREDCREVCQRNLYHTRQIRIAMGRDIDRLKRLALLEQGELSGALRAEHPDLMVGTSAGLQAQLVEATAALHPQADPIYLLDPLGNLVMRFGPDLDPRLIIKDLKRLLKASRIG